MTQIKAFKAVQTFFKIDFTASFEVVVCNRSAVY